nr:hypothetical protein [Rikenellaceae bacterium]
MKDIIIPARTIRRELWILLTLFVVAFLINVGAVWAYDRPWIELFSQLGFVVVITIALYLVCWIPRGIVRGLACVFRAKR